MIELGVNIDHIATVRQARRTYEPDPVWAAVEAHLGGADGITVHLREDRRHIRDDDVIRLRERRDTVLNLELATAADIVTLAARLKPHQATFVPERREEITTEGGLDLAASGGEAMMEDLPSLDELERRYVARVLAHTKGNISKAAKILGVDRKTLYRMREVLSRIAPTGESWDAH